MDCLVYLFLQEISQDSVKQRGGRAGREAPGEDIDRDLMGPLRFRSTSAVADSKWHCVFLVGCRDSLSSIHRGMLP